MEIINIFKELGLHEEHLEIYLANLEWGKTSISNIAYKSNIPRSTVYVHIEDLIELGIIRKVLEEEKKYYYPCDPEHLLDLLKRKELSVKQSIAKLETNISELKAMQKTTRKKPKVQYLEGQKGIKEAYNRTFEAEEIWIQCFTEDYKDVISEKFFDEYFDKFFSAGIRSKELLREDVDGDSEYMDKYGSEINLQLRVKTNDKVETDFWVYDDKVAFVSFDKLNPYALIIEDSSIADSMKSMFDQAWKNASREDKRIKNGEKIRVEF